MSGKPIRLEYDIGCDWYTFRIPLNNGQTFSATLPPTEMLRAMHEAHTTGNVTLGKGDLFDMVAVTNAERA